MRANNKQGENRKNNNFIKTGRLKNEKKKGNDKRRLSSSDRLLDVSKVIWKQGKTFKAKR